MILLSSGNALDLLQAGDELHIGPPGIREDCKATWNQFEEVIEVHDYIRGYKYHIITIPIEQMNKFDFWKKEEGEVDMKSDVAARLREELRTSQVPFEDGDVIKFTAFGQYSYAAIRSEGKWYFTGGRNSFGQGVTDSKMIEILKDDKQNISYINAEAGETIV